MKTKLLFLVLLVASSIYASPQKEIAEVKKNLNAEKRNVTQLSNKRDNVITSYQIAAKEYVSAKAKQDSLSHKPNSPAYKNAVKQTEKYGKKKDELLNSIEVLKQQIDSVNVLIAGYESTLLKLQNEQANAAKKKGTPKEQQRNNKSTQKTNTEEEKEVEDIPVEKDKKSNTVIQSTESEIDNQHISSEITHSNKDKEKPKNVPDWQNWLYTIGIGLLGVILFYYELKKNSRCPRCGKWFSYDEIGRTTAGKKGTRYIHHIKYKCRNCGYHHTKEVNTNAKNKYDVS
jgi:thiol:disulfide interchange protein/predicted nucleic-acid-binding Zn-ribbon protein